MAEVYHKYVRAGEKVPPPTKEQTERDENNARFTAARARKEEALATMREAEAKKRSNELIEKADVHRQASFLLISHQRRLLARSGPLSRKLVGKNEHEMRMIIDTDTRACLNELSTLPSTVTQAEYDDFKGSYRQRKARKAK